ncbi:MAG: hypothetical protein AB1489_33715 [Acidobacteriota bacterium]
MPTEKRSTTKKSTAKRSSATSQPLLPQAHESASADRLAGLLAELSSAIKQRRYDEVERVGNELLEVSPCEEADRYIHDIITSATTIRDAEDEIRYQLDDLKTVLKQTQESEPDGL